MQITQLCFLQSSLAISVWIFYLHFHMNFLIDFPISVEKLIVILMTVAMPPQINEGWAVFLTRQSFFSVGPNFYLPSFWRTFFSSCCIHLQVTSSFRFVCLFVLCQKKSLFHLNFGKVFLLDIEFYLDSFFVFFSFQYMERKTSCLTFSFALLLKRNKLLSWLTHAAVTGYHGLGGL